MSGLFTRLAKQHVGQDSRLAPRTSPVFPVNPPLDELPSQEPSLDSPATKHRQDEVPAQAAPTMKAKPEPPTKIRAQQEEPVENRKAQMVPRVDSKPAFVATASVQPTDNQESLKPAPFDTAIVNIQENHSHHSTHDSLTTITNTVEQSIEKKLLAPAPVTNQYLQQLSSVFQSSFQEQRAEKESVSKTIHVTIGRVDVRAPKQAASPTASKPKAAHKPVLNLEEYSKQRERGDR